MLAAVLSAPVPLSTHHWQPLILQCELIVGADSGGRALASGPRRLDVALGDFDSWISHWGDPQDHAHSVVRLPPEKDDSDTDAAVAHALEKGATEIWLFGGSGGRMDHWFSNWKLVERTQEIRRWYTSDEILVRLKSTEKATFPPGRLSVLPLGSGPWQLSSRGLDWELDEVDFGRRLSLSNRANQSAEIVVHRGQVLVVQGHSGQELAP